MLEEAILFCALACVTIIVLLVPSGVAKVGYEVYDVLIDKESWSYGFLGAAFVLILLLYLVEAWRQRQEYRPPWYIMLLLAGVAFYIALIGMAFFAKDYPSAPIIALMLQFPILIGSFNAFMVNKSGVSARHILKTTAAFCLGMSFLVILVWVAWISLDGKEWGRQTKKEVREEMSEIFARYGVDNWDACELQRSLGSTADATVLSHCSRLELITFLIWVSPGIEAMVLWALALFCAVRAFMVAQEEQAGRLLRFIFVGIAFFATVFWVACSTAGASMELSRVMFGCLGASGATFAVYVACTVDFDSFYREAQQSVIFKAAAPLLESDYFIALLFCGLFFFAAIFLALEFCVRQVERLLRGGTAAPGADTNAHEEKLRRLFTRRGLYLAKMVSRPSWPSVLEKAFKLCWLYLAFFLFSRFTPVFLAWLGDELATLNFGVVCIVFYLVGLVMFLLPPVPGVPVYMAAGTIIVARGREEPWLSFWSGILLASVMSLVLKLNAVAMQQKVIGEGFGKYKYVQDLVGVNTPSIQAIKRILERKGMGVEKVAILCGGPDWPTSVLTGILRLSLPEMILGTLPCFFLIVPCVLAGASLTEEQLRDFSPLIVMMVGLTQGGVLLAALVFIAKETEREPQSGIQPTEVSQKKHSNSPRWRDLGVFPRLLLLLGVAVEELTCCSFFFLGGWFFRKFALGDEINGRFEEGGLEGNVGNMIKTPGWAVLAVAAFGLLPYFLYSRLAVPKVATVVPDDGPGEGSRTEPDARQKSP